MPYGEHTGVVDPDIDVAIATECGSSFGECGMRPSLSNVGWYG